MSESEYAALCKSVSEIGLLNPIVLYQGMVLDGWNRYCACLDEMVLAPTVELASDIDPQVYVIAQNKERRHLTQSQLATAAIKVYSWLKDGVKQGSQASSAPSAEVKSAKEIAMLAGVSTKTVEEAKRVHTQATPEIKAKVESGELSASSAVKQMAKPKAPPEEVEPVYNELDKLKDDNAELKELIEELHYQISVKNYDGAEPIEDIVKELRLTKANLKQVTISRNGLQNELNAAKRQIIAQRKEIDKLKKQ